MQAAESLPVRAHLRLRHIDLRLVVGVLLTVVAIAAAASVINKARARTPVLVAAASVQPGEVIEASDLRVAEASLSGGVAYLPASMLEGIVGQVATEPLYSGKLLSPSSVSQAPPLPAGTVAMSLALKPESAVASTVRPGDAVAVIASTAPGRGEAQTTILFTSVAVLAVTHPDASEGGGVIVTLRLRLEEARALAAARAAGSVDLVLLSGAAQ